MRRETSYLSPVAPLLITEEDGYITGISFRECTESNAESPLLTETVRQLDAYFKGKLCRFTVPIRFHGTPFQEKVWNALLTIGYGQTVSYSEIARMTGNPKASRAVGSAVHVNPIAIIIPCHRVLGKNGSMTGYAPGIPIKEKLLRLEQEGIFP